MKQAWRAAVIGVCVMAAGCGYTTRSLISSQYRTIYITPFANSVDITRETDVGRKYRLYRPHLETDVTRSISDKYLFDGNLKPVESSVADVTLKGDLIEFRKDPLRYDTNDEVAEYRISVVVTLALTDNKNQELIWEEKRFAGEATYFPTTSTLPNVTKKTDDQAINDAIADLARRVVERTVEQW
jgi:hypothetical protein